MANDDKPIQPIVRKKNGDAKAEEAEETGKAEKAEQPGQPAAPAPTPVDPPEQARPEQASPQQAEPEAEATPSNPELSERFVHDKPVPALSRRVVDMKNYKTKEKKKPTEPDPMLVEKSQKETSPERPSAKQPSAKQEKPTVRVEAGSLSDFEAMLAEGADEPARQRLEVGEKYTGLITSIGEKWVYVDIDGGMEGIARTADYVDKEGQLQLTQGERREFYVLGRSEGTAVLGDQLSTREAAMDAIYTALDSGIPLTGRVAEKNKGGFVVDLGGVRAFCPISQIELAYTEDLDEHLGQSYRFRVTEIREDGKSIVVSRAALLKEEQEVAAAKTLEDIHEGMIVEGTVTRVAEFGAFVDIGGVEGLIHVSELGFTRVEHPDEVVNKGDTVNVKILNITEDERGMRIGLSMKETMEDPWEAAMKDVHVGATLTGTVNRLEPFGAFVEVAPNVEGLVHVSEMSWEKHVKRPSDVVSVGQQVSVEVQDVDLPRRRISLSMKSAAGDPWNDIADLYKPGQQVEGTVENVEDFGAFIGLGSGITALIPRSEMGLARNGTPHSKFSQGDKVTARVLAIEPQRRRMSLTLKSAEEIEDTSGGGQRTYSDTGSSSLGTFGDLLKDKLEGD